MTNTSSSSSHTEANIEALMAALQFLDSSGGAGATMEAKPIGEPSPRSPADMRLSELVVALHRMGINIVSPREMINREQIACDAELAAQISKKQEEELRVQRALSRRFVNEEAFRLTENRVGVTTGARAPLSSPSNIESVDIDSVSTLGSVSSLGSSDFDVDADLNTIVGVPAAAVSGHSGQAAPSVVAVPVNTIAGIPAGAVSGNNGQAAHTVGGTAFNVPSSAQAAPTPGAATLNVGNASAADGSNTVPADNQPGHGDDVLKGFVCVACNTYNLLRPAKGSWYAVTNGRKVGVFCDWTTVQPLVTGVSHACFKRYPTEAAATKAFQEAVALGHVVY